MVLLWPPLCVETLDSVTVLMSLLAVTRDDPGQAVQRICASEPSTRGKGSVSFLVTLARGGFCPSFWVVTLPLSVTWKVGSPRCGVCLGCGC